MRLPFRKEKKKPPVLPPIKMWPFLSDPKLPHNYPTGIVAENVAELYPGEGLSEYDRARSVKLFKDGVLKALDFKDKYPNDIFPLPVITNSEQEVMEHMYRLTGDFWNPFEIEGFFTALAWFNKYGNPLDKRPEENAVAAAELFSEAYGRLSDADIATLEFVASTPQRLLKQFYDDFELDIPWHYPLWKPREAKPSLKTGLAKPKRR